MHRCTNLVVLGEVNLDCAKEPGQTFAEKLYQNYGLKQLIDSQPLWQAQQLTLSSPI